MNKKEIMHKISSIITTDMYNLTMAYAYWKLGRHTDQAVYYLSFRHNPFKGGFVICAGLQTAIDNIIQNFHIND